MNACLQESPRKDLIPLKPTRRRTLILPLELVLDIDFDENVTGSKPSPADTCPVIPSRRYSCIKPLLHVDYDGSSCHSLKENGTETPQSRQQSPSTSQKVEDAPSTTNRNIQHSQGLVYVFRKTPPQRHHSAPSSPRKNKRRMPSTTNLPNKRTDDLTSSDHGQRRRRTPTSDSRQYQFHRSSDEEVRRWQSSKGSFWSSSSSSNSSNKIKKNSPSSRGGHHNSTPKRAVLHRRWESARSLDIDLETIDESELSSSDEFMRSSSSFSSSLKLGKPQNRRHQQQQRIVVHGRSRSKSPIKI